MKRIIAKASPSALHPWIYKKRVVDTNDAQPGDDVLVYNTKGQFVGSYIFNPNSVLALRRYSHRPEPLDYLAIKERIYKAFEIRRFLFRDTGETSYRVVFGESDMLPGLIVDKYEKGLVFQITTLAMEKRKEEIIKTLEDIFEPIFIIEKSDSVGRKDEGLPPKISLIKGKVKEPIKIKVEGIFYYVEILSGNKTGFFFDQRYNRLRLEHWSKGRCLDLFSYTGGFTLHLLKGGAQKVYAVDTNQNALNILKENLLENGFRKESVVTFNKDVFEFLDEMVLAGEFFDVIVLDPPAFTHKRSGKHGALKGYRVLHDRVLRLLRPSGILATFSCSMHISADELLGSVERAASVLRRTLVVIERLQQSPDHPVLLGFRESEYLKGWILRVV